MKIGFTGTRRGITEPQREMVTFLLDRFVSGEFHHGVCEGADVEAAFIAQGRGYTIVEHPPVDKKCLGVGPATQHRRAEKTMFARNRDIVDETDVLISCPFYDEPIIKTTLGGTAYTTNYCRKRRKQLYIVRPDGRVESESGNAEVQSLSAVTPTQRG